MGRSLSGHRGAHQGADIPRQNYVITDYGKRVDNQGHLYTSLINETIKRCNAEGAAAWSSPPGHG